MNPDVAAAVRELGQKGVLSRDQARHLLRISKGDLVSVYHDLRLLLYAGVVLTTAGVGILVQQNLGRLGPIAITAGLGLAAAACFFWIGRHAPPFSWRQAASTHLAFDYILLLGVLLASADVAYVEARFTPLGPNWPWHLLLASLFMAGLALRFDSRVVFSLALSTFASWRGVSVSLSEGRFWSNFGSSLRFNTAGCGVLFVLLGFFLARAGKKSHFEPVASYLGWILILLSLASGSLTHDRWSNLYTVVLLLTGAGLAIHSFVRRRFPLFAMGVLGAYVGLSRWLVPALDDETLVFLWFFSTSVASIFALTRVHRIMGRAS